MSVCRIVPSQRLPCGSLEVVHQAPLKVSPDGYAFGGGALEFTEVAPEELLQIAALCAFRTLLLRQHHPATERGELPAPIDGLGFG